MAAPERPAPPALPGPVAWLTGQYPKMSHTFIQREVEALRGLGLEVLTCQVRRAPPEQIAPDQAAEAAATFTILDAARAPHRLLGAHLRLLARAPRRWTAMLGLALRTRPPGLRALLWQLFYFAEAGVLADHLHRRGVVHLHNHFADSSCSVAMLAAGLANLPYSFTEHGPNIFFDAPRWRLDAKVARARFVACISRFCRSQIMLFSDPAHWDRLHVVRCGIDPARYDRGPRSGSGRRALFVGRLDAVKGVRLLLQAVAGLRADWPDLTLTLIGDGPERAALEAQAATPALSGAVRFAGLQGADAVAAALAEHDMLVLPSFAEGVPMVLMEALASRLPVVATQVGGVAELVRDGERGLLVPPGDAEALADAMARLLADPALGLRMGEAGHRFVATHHDARQEAARLAALIAAAHATGA